jgi:hypothetical protein
MSFCLIHFPRTHYSIIPVFQLQSEAELGSYLDDHTHRMTFIDPFI